MSKKKQEIMTALDGLLNAIENALAHYDTTCQWKVLHDAYEAYKAEQATEKDTPQYGKGLLKQMEIAHRCTYAIGLDPEKLAALFEAIDHLKIMRGSWREDHQRISEIASACREPEAKRDKE